MSATHAVALPPPLVRARRHPLKWVVQTVAAVIALVIGAHLGKFIVVALYYVFFETWHPLTTAWHHAVSDNYTRHLIRDVGEGLLGGTLGQMLAWNAYRHRLKKPHWFDRLEMRLRIPNLTDERRLTAGQLLLGPVFVLVYAIPGFAVAFGLVALAKHYGSDITHAFAALPHQATYWQKVRNIWTGNWDKVLVGLFASLFLGRRPVRKIANDVQLWFAEHRVRSHKPVRWYHTPSFKARVHDVEARMARGEEPRSDIGHAGLDRTMMVGGLVVGLALAGFGYYVLTVIATRH